MDKDYAMNIYGLKEVVKTLFVVFAINHSYRDREEYLSELVKFAEKAADFSYTLEYKGVYYRLKLNTEVLTSVFEKSVETDWVRYPIYYHVSNEAFMESLVGGLEIIP